ncbi:hypothetical protein MASR1M74_17370 [Lentimicrobium sp.]
MKHFTIPIFVPELACPNRCVFCNQHSISGCQHQPQPAEVREIIEQHLNTLPQTNSHIEIGFFGGSFTGIEPDLQEQYLAVAREYLLHSRRINGIRLSTRPDYIDEAVLSRLKHYGVSLIELGAQSLNDEVLKLSGRGHSVRDVEQAAAMIKSHGFKLGLQMMTGLPCDTPEKSFHTAQRIVELGADCTRIYPTLVIRGTELEQRWRKGKYQPQTLNEAVALSAELLAVFNKGKVEVIRIGLHPSEEILYGNELLAGPFHPSFRELVETYAWEQKLKPLIKQHPQGGNISITVPPQQLRYAVGYNSSNRKLLEKHFKEVEFVIEQENGASLPLIITDKRLPLPAKNALHTLGKTLFLQSSTMVYKSIGGHPDIFMCADHEKVVVAPGLPDEIKATIEQHRIRLFTGQANPDRTYPDSARYNAVVTEDYIIHHLKITDPIILSTFPGRKHIHVNQGYTRCNLLALSHSHFLTSDRGIEKALQAEGKRVLYVDPQPVRLPGQKHGFFPGCCGIIDKTVLVAGSLAYHHEKAAIVTFIQESGMEIHELYKGVLTDVGGIFVFGSALD